MSKNQNNVVYLLLCLCIVTYLIHGDKFKESKEKKLFKRMIKIHSRGWGHGYWDTYEQALEVGLQESLKLIKQ